MKEGICPYWKLNSLKKSCIITDNLKKEIFKKLGTEKEENFSFFN